MWLKIILKVIIIILLVSAIELQAQENINDTAKLTGKTATHPNWTWQIQHFCLLNFDFRRKEKSALSLGITASDDGFFPFIMGYYFGGEKRMLEIGGGMCSVVNSDGILGISFHGVIGYTYQKKKGLIFRIGFTPLYAIGFSETGKSMFVPLAGVSFGYSF